MTLLRSCSEVALREFFLEHVGEIMATIEANLSKVEEDREMKDFAVNSDNFSSCSSSSLSFSFSSLPPLFSCSLSSLFSFQSSLESQLVSKICCFQFVEVLYTRLPPGALNNLESMINMAYCRGQAKTGKEMTQTVTKCVARTLF